MDLNQDLDIFGQQPGLSNLYTQICCCFPVADASSHPAIVNTLTKGLEQLSAHFPWVAGQVVHESSGEGKPGIFRIKPLENTPRLVVKDLRDDPAIPTMDALKQANFPFGMLDETIVAPRNTLPGMSDEPTSPVFLLQATFVTGGLLLTFVGQHNVMDMTGQGQVINLLSKACHGESFTREELVSGNPDRRNAISLLDAAYEPGSELDNQIKKPTPLHTVSSDDNDYPAPPAPTKCSWAYFTFDSTSLAALKALAMKPEDNIPSSGFVSTDDALSAFIWRSIIRARLPRLDPTTIATLGRAVDLRRYLNISPTYPGVALNMTYHTYPCTKLVEEPLDVIASQLRSAVDLKSSNIGYRTRALATLLDRAPDKSTISVTATLDTSKDIMLSSWAKQNFHDLDFNLGLGKPLTVRRPQFPAVVEGLLYLMPKALDGEIAAGLCLRDEDIERLRMDDEFAKYSKYIG